MKFYKTNFDHTVGVFKDTRKIVSSRYQTYLLINALKHLYRKDVRFVKIWFEPHQTKHEHMLCISDGKKLHMAVAPLAHKRGTK